MINTLIVYYNPWIFAQELVILKELGRTDYDVYISPSYVSIENMSKQIEWIKTHSDMDIVDLTQYEEYDVIIRPTPQEVNQLDMLYSMYPNAQFHYVEEGLSLYNEDDPFEYIGLLDKKFIYKGTIWASFPERLKIQTKELSFKTTVEIVNELFKKEIEKLPTDVEYIIFTEPYLQDHNDEVYIHLLEDIAKRVRGNMLLKKHPRDTYNYDIDAYLCDNTLPGQALYFVYPNAKFLFTDVSTVTYFAPKDVYINTLFNTSHSSGISIEEIKELLKNRE